MKLILKSVYFWALSVGLFLLIILFSVFPGFFSSATLYKRSEQALDDIRKIQNKAKAQTVLPFDTVAYDKKLNEIANNPPIVAAKPITKIIKDPKTGKKTIITIPAKDPPPKTNLWPAKAVYSNAGALLPFHRIVAYYGNLYSTKMGVLGEYPEAEMLTKLNTEVKKWNVADPATPVIPALHYIAVVAQGSPGDSGKYRIRMPYAEIDKILAMAAKIPASPHDNSGAGGNAIVFLDVQVGFSNVQTEVPLLEKYLKLPNVHLAIDPEFSMKTGIRPGKIVGTLDAEDINFVSNYLANIVKENNLTPKILIIHRYTQRMVTNYRQIKTLPEVQIVMNMDGWGDKAKKIDTYRQFIYKEPVQFTGFKLFYKNDVLTKGTKLMTPNKLLKLNPQPIYIQYQ